MTKIYYVYEIVCSHPDYSGFKYIGSHYGTPQDAYLGSGSYLKAVKRNIGSGWFTKTVLEVCQDRNSMIERESFHLKSNDCAKDTTYFNLTNEPHFSGTLGTKWYHCPVSGTRICAIKKPNGFKEGSNSDSTKDFFWVYHPTTLQGLLVKGIVPDGFVKGNIHNLGKTAHNKGVPCPTIQRNSLSDEWAVTFPDGSVKHIRNMLSFCKEHDLNPSAMSAVARGKRRIYKGFKCVKTTNNRNVEYIAKDFVPCVNFKFRGKSGGLNNNAVPIIVYDTKYESMKEASTATGLSYYKLRKIGEKYVANS